MLSSCSNCVMNIDNGYGAAMAAIRIIKCSSKNYLFFSTSRRFSIQISCLESVPSSSLALTITDVFTHSGNFL